MALDYHFSFTAPASVSANDLERFLQGVEDFAQSLGFEPTTLLNIPFDTPERRTLARRLGVGIYVESEKLKGAAAAPAADAERHDAINGSCRLVPHHAVVLVLTDEQANEICLGFMRYAAEIRDVNGKPVAESGTGDAWAFRNLVSSPDRRYRQIVKKFADAGYLASENDEYIKSLSV